MTRIYSSDSTHRAKTLRPIAAAIVGACALVAAAGIVIGPTKASQITPLEDVVPLTQSEVRVADLIDLAGSVADAVRELKTAELSVKMLQSLQPSATITGLEMHIAQINVQTAEHKVRILRAIAEEQLASAQTRLEFLRRIGAAPNGQAQVTDSAVNPRIRQAESVVRIVQMILDIK